ncbi:MAG: histidine phosphatase family protein [Actinobacteria bacterium]|nr:histidine phosphatase family protein [Actinomycetota bacterium]
MKLYLVRHGQSTGNIGGTLMGQSDHPLTPLGEDQARAAAERLAPFGPMPVYASDLPRARATAEHIVAAWREADVADAPQVILDPRLREISLGDYEGRPWQEFEADVELTAAFAADPYRTALPNGESLQHLEARAHAAVLDILAPFGVDDTGASCGNAVSQGDASAVDRNAEAMRAGAAAAAVDGASAADAAALEGAAAAVAADDAMAADEGLPETMDASAVATGFHPTNGSGSACLVAHDGPIRAILNHYLGVPPEKWWTLSTTHGGVSLIEFAGGCVTIRYVNATGHLAGLEPDQYVPSDA